MESSAALAAAGTGLGGPAIDVEMHPGAGIGDEAAQEQGRGDRAGEAAGRRIVHIGDFRVHHCIVGRPERHLPERVVAQGAGLHERAGKGIVGAVKRG